MEIERRQRARDAPDVAQHPWRLPKDHVEVDVDGPVAELRVRDGQVAVARGRAEDRERAPLALADGAEPGEPVGAHRERIAFLRLVAPDLARRHARFLARHSAQVDRCAATRGVSQLRERVGEAAGADVMDRQDRARLAQRRASVDDFLRPSLDLGVAALHGVEVEVGDVRSGRERGGGAAAHADQHPRPAELDQQRARRHRRLERVRGADVAHAARDHDRLVIAAGDAAGLHLEGAEGAGEVGTAELVVERGGADRPLEHDLERRGDPVRLPEVALPRLLEPGDAEVRDAEAAQPCLGLRAAPGRALVAELAARACRCARKRRDCRRVVVSLDLREQVRELRVASPAAVGVGKPPVGHAALEDRGIVRVRDDGALGARRVGLADHPEERLILRRAVDDPRRVEDLVPAVLGVRLREHRELDVGRVAVEPREHRGEVVDLLIGQREAQLGVGALERTAARGAQRHQRERARGGVLEQRVGRLDPVEHGLGHAVVEACGYALAGPLARDVIGDPPLDAADGGEPAVVRDVGGLRRPRRDRPEARSDEV